MALDEFDLTDSDEATCACVLSEEVARTHTVHSKVRKIEEAFRQSITESQGPTGWDDLCSAPGRSEETWPLLQEALEKSQEFSLACDPMELRELGSGYVLFFWLVKYLGLLLLTYTFVLIPVLVENINTSPWEHNHTRANRNGLASFNHLQDNPGVCERCTGNVVDGVPFTGPLSNSPDYGTDCQTAWDLGNCEALAGVSSPGAWCCKRWCYVSSECLSARHSSLSNGLYYNYQACEDVPEEHSVCVSSGWSNSSTDFEGQPLADTSTMEMTTWMLLTPGNFGHKALSSRHSEICFVLVVVLALCAATVLEQMRSAIDEEVDDEATHPNDFAILVSGFPADATDHNEIRRFFEQHAIESCALPADAVVSVVIAWDITAYAALMSRKNNLEQHIVGLRALGKSDDEIEEDIQEQFDEFVHLIEANSVHDKCAHDRGTNKSGFLTSSGCAVVVFNTQAQSRACLRRWDGFKAGICKFCMLGCIYDLLDLPRFRDGQEASYRLRVERAPNPKDIRWESLGTPLWKRVLFGSLSWLALGGVMLLAFWACYHLARGQDQMKEERPDGVISCPDVECQVMSLMPALAITVSALILQVVARISGAWQPHVSRSIELGSLGLKLTVALLINSGAVPYAAVNFRLLDGDSSSFAGSLAKDLWFSARNGTLETELRDQGPWDAVTGWPAEWYKQGGLADEMFFVLLLSALTTPIWVIVPYWWTNYFWLWRIDPETADMWSYTLRGERALYPVTQEEYNSFHEPMEPDPAWMYAEVVELYLVAVLYAPLLPVGLPIAALGLFLFYWSAKYGLLRLWKFPEVILGPQLAQKSLTLLKYVHCLLLPVTTCIFLTPSLTPEARGNLYFSMWVVMLLSLTFPTLLRLCLLLRHCSQAEGDQEAEDFGSGEDPDGEYYVVQQMWPPDRRYTRTHVLYRALPEDVCPLYAVRPADGDDPAEQAEDLTVKIVATLRHMYRDAISELKGVRSGVVPPTPLHREAGSTPAYLRHSSL